MQGNGGYYDPAEAAARAFREALSYRADTVHLLVYRTSEGKVAAMTATAISPLSLSPPSLLICVNQSSRSCEELRRAGSLGVGMLRSSQLDLALNHAKSGGDKTLPPGLTRSVTSTGHEAAPALADALVQFQCRLVSSHDAFTHTIFIAEVLGVDLGSEGSPLLHHLGGFAAVGEPVK